MRRVLSAALIGSSFLALCTITHAQQNATPRPPLDPTDAPTLRKLPDYAQDITEDVCKASSKLGPAEYHQCIKSYANSPEIARLKKLSRDDRILVLGKCADLKNNEAAGNYQDCISAQINDAAGVPKPLEPAPPPPPHLTFIEKVEQAAADLPGWAWFSAGGVFVLGVVILGRRRRRVVSGPQAVDPYGGGAMHDFQESNAFGDARFATASELHQAMRGASSYGEQPKFKE